MVRLFLLILLIIISNNSFALQSCGTIILRGKYTIKEDKLNYVVYEKTNSELTFDINKKEDEEKIAGFLNKESELKADLIRIDGTNGTLENIAGLKLVVPDPLMLNSGERIKFISKKSCKN